MTYCRLLRCRKLTTNASSTINVRLYVRNYRPNVLYDDAIPNPRLMSTSFTSDSQSRPFSSWRSSSISKISESTILNTTSILHSKKQSICSRRHLSSVLTSSTDSNNNLEPLYDSEDEMIVDLDALQKLASQRPTPLCLADMYKYAVMKDQGQRLRNAQFLHKELPIRIAQRAYDLLTLPRGLNQSKPIRSVAYIYLRYLKLFEDNPSPKTLQEEEAFTQMLTSIMLDRTTIPKDIARGIQLWRQQQQQQEQQIDIEQDQQSLQDMEDALYRFFTARVGLRFLTEHHILSSTNLTVQRQNVLKNDHWFLQSSQQQHQQEDCSSNIVNSHLGCIQTDCNPVEQIQLVANRITEQAMAKYGVCPQIKIISSAEKHRFTYVPHHLQYMVAELLKNSCHATIRNSAKKGLSTNNQLQPIRIVIVLGAEDVSIKIADRGGGVPRSTMKKIFQFTHSTKHEDDEDDFVIHETSVDDNDIRGFGLPLCRIYARYFGGELTLKSMEGYGLDAYLHLPRLGDACENLPRTVMSSPGGQVSMPTV